MGEPVQHLPERGTEAFWYGESDSVVAAHSLDDNRIVLDLNVIQARCAAGILLALSYIS